MRVWIALAAAAVALGLSGQQAQAACETTTAKDDIGAEEAVELYNCIEASLLEAYAKSGLAVVGEYRGWALASTNPFISGTHGNRFVNHYVNAVGEELYLTFFEDGQKMPVGTITAKESFNISKKGKVRKGPLFLMEKVAAGAMPESDDWKYTIILPNGKIMGESGAKSGKKVKFCHDCHINVLEGQDAMFFPIEEYRVGGE